MQIIPEKTYRQNLRESEEREERDIRLRYRDEYMALLNFIEGRTAV